MALQRIKGQEVEVRLIVDNQLVANLTEVKSFEMSLQTEILKEGYLGETTDRRDEVFRGITGKMDLHMTSGAMFDLLTTIANRAQRRQPNTNTKINVKVAFNFPNAPKRIAVINNLFFGEMPINTGGRTEYVSVSLSFEADEIQFIS